MSDLERSVLARADELQRQRDEQAVVPQAEAHHDEKNEAELRRLLEMGKRAVDLLVSYGVESRTTWGRKVVGTRPVPTQGRRGFYTRQVETIDWVEQGHGWEIFRSVYMHSDGGSYQSATGLQDDGRLFTIGGRGVPPAVGSGSKDIRAGLAVHDYLGQREANFILESDLFKDGLAYRLKNWGIYTVTSEEDI